MPAYSIKIHLLCSFHSLTICQILGISRPTLSRMLSACKAQGIVKIKICNPDNLLYSQVKQKMEKIFGLQEVIIVSISTRRREPIRIHCKRFGVHGQKDRFTMNDAKKKFLLSELYKLSPPAQEAVKELLTYYEQHQMIEIAEKFWVKLPALPTNKLPIDLDLFIKLNTAIAALKKRVRVVFRQPTCRMKFGVTLKALKIFTESVISTE